MDPMIQSNNPLADFIIGKVIFGAVILFISLIIYLAWINTVGQRPEPLSKEEAESMEDD